MNSHLSDWELNYLNDSSRSSTFQNGDSRINNDGSNALQSWNVVRPFNRDGTDPEYLESSRCSARDSNSLLQASSNGVKMLDFSSNSAKISTLDQTEFCSYAFHGPLLPNDLNKSASEGCENQENCRRAVFDVSESDNVCIDEKNEAGSPLYAVAAGVFSKITDFLTAPISNASSVRSQIGGKGIGSVAAKSPCVKSSSSYVCSQCSRTFRTKLLLTHHSDTHNPSKSHRCTFPDCERAFRSQKYLDNHLNDHHRVSPTFKCPHSHCIYVGRKKSDVKSHISSNHRTPRLDFSPKFTSCDTGWTDEFFDDAVEVMSRNVKEIYASRSAASPSRLINTASETIAIGISGDHFSPDETCSTISVPSFSNGVCSAESSMTPPPINISCPSPVPHSSCAFTDHGPQLSYLPISQCHTGDTMPSSSAGVVKSPNDPRQPYFPTQSPFGKDCSSFQSKINNMHYLPLGSRGPSFESNGYYEYNGEQDPYASQWGFNAGSYTVPQAHQSYYHPQPQSAPRIPYNDYKGQSQTPSPFATGGSAYGQVSPSESRSTCHQYFYQQPCLYQQQSFFHRFPQRQRHCSPTEAQQLSEAPEQSPVASIYPTVSQQIYDSPATAWSSSTSYHHTNGQPRHLGSGTIASAVFHGVMTPPHFPLG